MLKMLQKVATWNTRWHNDILNDQDMIIIHNYTIMFRKFHGAMEINYNLNCHTGYFPSEK